MPRYKTFLKLFYIYSLYIIFILYLLYTKNEKLPRYKTPLGVWVRCV